MLMYRQAPARNLFQESVKEIGRPTVCIHTKHENYDQTEEKHSF